MIYLIIWLIGFIAFYIITRYDEGPSDDWAEVFNRTFFSIFWPIVLFWMFLIFCGELNPPKWL